MYENAINLTPKSEKSLNWTPGAGKWLGGPHFIKLKRGSTGRAGGAHSGLCGWKARRYKAWLRSPTNRKVYK